MKLTNETPSPSVRRYLAQMGSKGGKKSRRLLSPSTARQMVALREARKAFRTHRHEYFWSYRDDTPIAFEDIGWILEALRTEGNRRAYEQARRIERLLKESPCP
jgi:hypothetical protein